MKQRLLLVAATLAALLGTACQSTDNQQNNDMEELKLTFEVNPGVRREKAHFHNRFGIELVGDLYLPATLQSGDKAPAIAISGPFGAVKEQSSGYYANQMAAAGYIALAFDPSFTGESGGEPRYVASIDINTEDFSAAVDYLMLRDDVEADAVGIIGICGWGGMALNAAANDTRIRATMAVTMYDMHRVTANGYFDSADSPEARRSLRQTLNAQRLEDYRNGYYRRAGGVIDPLPDDAPQFVKDYYAYYKTERGYAKNSLNSNEGWNATSQLSLLNTPILTYADEIESAVMVLHGEKAHSRYFGEDAFKRLRGENKHLVIVPGASHCDLYDGGPDHNRIPWESIIAFFDRYLNNGQRVVTKAHTMSREEFERQTRYPIGAPNDAYARYFIGQSHLAPMEAAAGGPVNVTFEPACRNNWHIHHRATQVLICVAGRGWYQEEGKAPFVLAPGVVIAVPQGVKHWHGAARDSWMQHLTYNTHVGENPENEWLEPVDDAHYEQLQ